MAKKRINASEPRPAAAAHARAPRKRTTKASPAPTAASQETGTATTVTYTPVTDDAPAVQPVAEPAVQAVADRAPSADEIARTAYSYWLARGCQGGSPEEDWYRAERELRNRQALTAEA